MNDNNWRRVESPSIEALVERILGWVAVVVLLGVVAGCALTARPLCSTGATVILAALARARRGSDP